MFHHVLPLPFQKLQFFSVACFSPLPFGNIKENLSLYISKRLCICFAMGSLKGVWVAVKSLQ